VKGKTAKTPDPLPTDEQLKAIRERLTSKQYEKVHGILEKKGWIIGTGAGRSQLEGAFTA
jgi:D-arabinose 5-phosphate isomerase GutQ